MVEVKISDLVDSLQVVKEGERFAVIGKDVNYLSIFPLGPIAVGLGEDWKEYERECREEERLLPRNSLPILSRQRSSCEEQIAMPSPWL